MKSKTVKKLVKATAKTKKLIDKLEQKMDAAIASKSMQNTGSILEDMEDIEAIAQNIIDTIEGNHQGMRTREEIAADVEKQIKALRKKQACKHPNWIQKPKEILIKKICSDCGEKVYH
jgi:hypothetical protein